MAWVAAAAAAAGAVANAVSQSNANKANQEEAHRNRVFQADMSNTAYQRAVSDMKLAGLNPMLAGINQSSASTPSGAQAAKIEATNIGEGLKSASSTGLAVQRQNSEIEKQGSETVLNKEQANTQDTVRALNLASASRANAEGLKADAQAIGQQYDNEVNKYGISANKAAADAKLAQERANLKYSNFDNTIQRVNAGSGAVSNAKEALNPFSWIRGNGNKPQDSNSKEIKNIKDYLYKQSTRKK